jgi:hypothetical protein
MSVAVNSPMIVENRIRLQNLAKGAFLETVTELVGLSKHPVRQPSALPDRPDEKQSWFAIQSDVSFCARRHASAVWWRTDELSDRDWAARARLSKQAY